MSNINEILSSCDPSVLSELKKIMAENDDEKLKGFLKSVSSNIQAKKKVRASVEEKPVDFITERHKRRMKRDARRAYKVYMQEHPEIAAQHKLKHDETQVIRDHMNDDQNKDEEWMQQYKMIHTKLPKDPEKKRAWIEKYNEVHEKFHFSIQTGKTPSGFDYEAYRLERK